MSSSKMSIYGVNILQFFVIKVKQMHFQQNKMSDATDDYQLYGLEPPHHPVPQETRKLLQNLSKRYYQLEQKFKAEPFFQRKEYYVLSKRWLERWKVYVGYKEINSAAPPTKFFGCGKLPTANEDIVESYRFNTFDFDDPQWNLNVRLKEGLMQGRDYEFITKEMHYCLNDCNDYQMIRIPRNVVTTAEGKKVELYYYKLNLLLIWHDYCKDIESSRVSKLVDVVMQYSHYETVGDLVDETSRYLKAYIQRKRNFELQKTSRPIKFWLLPFDTEKNILFNTIRQGCLANNTYEYKLFMDGEFMDPLKKLSDYQITDDRWIVCELKEAKSLSWMFFNQKNVLEGTCLGCRQKKTLSVLCSCKYAAYCSTACKSRDKYTHRGRCPNQGESEDDEQPLALSPDSKKGLVGLRNLGNTCFMNSGLQCISHIKEFVDYFVTDQRYLKEINKKNPLGTKGELSTAYAKLLQNLWLGKENSIAPSVVKRAIGKFQPMFSGYNQHDSSQLINYMLDGLHQDLNRVIDKPYTETKDYDGRPDHIVAAEAWQIFLKRNQSIIVDQMYGQYKSVVDCPKCEYESIQFDPFLVCSLPLVNNNKKDFTVTFVKQHVEQIKLTFTYDLSSRPKISHLIQFVRTRMQLPKEAALIAYSASYSQCNTVADDTLVEQVRKEYSYRTLYIRELLKGQNPETDRKIMLNNVYCNSMYGSEHYRRQIIGGRLYFFSKDLTYKQVHYKLYSYYKQYYEVANYENQVINVQAKEQPFRFLFIPSSHYYACQYCGKKGCDGCLMPFTDQPFLKNVDAKEKVEIELYWRKNDKEIIERMENKTNETKKGPSSKGGIKIADCFELFSEPQILNQENAWFCPKCKDFVLAKKQMKIYRAPKILVLALKRFKRKEYFAEKYNIFVDYPLNDFDMSKYIISPKLPQHSLEQKDGMQSVPMYDLIGVSNHMGSTGGGHYTAFCKDILSEKWYQFDDSYVSPVKNEESVVSSSGYVLFYRRRD